MPVDPCDSGFWALCDIIPEILESLLREQELQKVAIDAYIQAVSDAGSFASANELAELLPYIADISSQQVNGLVAAFNGNYQANHAYDLKREIVRYIKEWTGETYSLVKIDETDSFGIVRPSRQPR